MFVSRPGDLLAPLQEGYVHYVLQQLLLECAVIIWDLYHISGGTITDFNQYKDSSAQETG